MKKDVRTARSDDRQRLAIALVALAACGDGFQATPDAGIDAPSCATSEVELRVTRDPLGPSRLYALVQHEGLLAALLVDTGSQISFLSHDGPDGAPNVGEVDFGCERRQLRGRPFHSDERVEGRRVVGFLGNDFFLEKQRTFDLPASRIREGTCPATWPRAAIENRFDYLFVMANVNGNDLRLGFDTGAAHTLWLKQDGDPGDQIVSSQDANGNPLTFYLGTASLAVAGEAPHPVPILRTQSFPSLEATNAAIGGGIDGLLGLSTMGDRRFCIDAVDSSIRFEPTNP